MSVHKDKKGNWYVKYQNKTKRGFKTKREALNYEAMMKMSNEKSPLQVCIYDVIDDFLKLYKTRVSYVTYNKTEYVMMNVIVPNIKNIPISKITEKDVRLFNDFVYDLNYSTVHKNYIMNVYKRIFNHAYIYYQLPNNPTRILVPFKKTYNEKMKTRDKEKNVWTVDQFNEFIKCVDKEMYKELFVILYFTGLRLGEALALKWEDFHDNKLFVYKSITRKTDKGPYEEKEPKNVSSNREIALGKNLNDYLYDFKIREEKIKGFNEKWFIFGRLKPLPQTSIDRVKDNAIKEAKVPRIRIHDFRHSHASNLIANGVNIVAVSKRLGHSDINMTLKIYTHLIQKSDDELVNFINDSSQFLLKK